jgi:uncharacterized protein DUF4124
LEIQSLEIKSIIPKGEVKMNRIIFIIVVMIFCAGIGFSYAELYKWVDKDGVEHFSNDPSPSDIPPDTSVETADETLYDPAADAEREKQDKKTMKAVNSEEAAMEKASQKADEQAAQPPAPAPSVVGEDEDVYWDEHDARREKELHDKDKLNEPHNEKHPEVRHEHEVHENKVRNEHGVHKNKAR